MTIFLGLKLNPGVTPLNVIAHLVVLFNTYASMAIIMIFSSFILEDKRYYHLDENQVAGTVG